MKNSQVLKDTDDPRSCVCFLLSRAAQAAQKHLRTALEPHGLTPAQYLIIECLWLSDRMSPKVIGELLRFDSATLTGLVDRLERGGFVFRQPDPGDRRAIRVCLTDKSLGMKVELRALRLRANEEILKIFPRQQRGVFKQALVSLIAADNAAPAADQGSDG